MNSKITRQDCHEYVRSERVDWLDAFAKEQAKKENSQSTAVDKARERDQKSMLDQISYIIDKKPRHASVESAVKDMQDRTGLSEYIKRLSVLNETGKKTAQEEKPVVDVNKLMEPFEPELQKKIFTFVKNKVESSQGNLATGAIVADLAHTLRQDGLDESDISTEDFSNWIDQLRDDVKKRFPMDMGNDQNFGKDTAIDDESNMNDDVFKNMMGNK
jgi:hypothetical protein